MSAAATGPVVLAGNRQMQTGSQIGGLFLIVWGGMFAGIALAIIFMPHGSRSDGPAVLLVFMLVGFAAFFGGLYLVLVRREVLLDATRTRIVECKSFLGSERVTSHARQLFDHVYLGVEIGQKGSKSYPLALRGKADAQVSLGTFYERNEARSAGIRAARGAGLAFEERLETGGLLKLTPQELAKVPMAKSSGDQPWWQKPSALALLGANLVPVWGVLAWGWSILSVMLLFWLENVIIGLFTIGKILLSRGNAEGSGPAFALPLVLAGNLFIAAFFTVHYGMFCAGHGMFILSMFGGGPGTGRIPDVLELPQIVHDLLLRQGLLWAAIALVASHGISFVTHYLRPRAYEDAIAAKLMFDPYKRIVILHVVIMVGGFCASIVGSSVAPLLLLIALKIAVDLNAHRREHAVPYERELRDYLTVHGSSFVRAEKPPAAPPAALPAAAPVVEDRNDQPLAHYFGTWRADPQAAVPPGWIARAEFRDAGGKPRVKLWSQAASGLADEGEFDAALRGNVERIEFIEVRQQGQGRVRIARFTGSDGGANHLDLNEIQHPEGKSGAMQARSLTLYRG